MSTHIKTIKGVTESVIDRNYKVPCHLSLTRFYGGATNRAMLQLTINSDFIQLTTEEVIELAKTLLNSFDHKIYPSE